MSNNIVWVSIPVTDLSRAIEFYRHVTGLRIELMPGTEDRVAVAVGPEGENTVSFDLSTYGVPSMEGAAPYLNSGGDIQAMVARVGEAGGQVLQAPEYQGEMIGWTAWFVDSEGNRIGIEEMGKPA
jgi:predicted enzyme related to lactoylglutathione lyase